MSTVPGMVQAAVASLAGVFDGGLSLIARRDIKRAQEAIVAGDAEEAVEILQGVVERLQKLRRRRGSSGDAVLETTARSLLGQALATVGKGKESDQHYRVAIELWGDDTATDVTADDWAAHAIALWAVSRPDEAILTMQEARRRGDTSSGSALKLARWLTTRNRTEEAETVVKEALEAHPLDPDLAIARAELLRRDGAADAGDAYKAAAVSLALGGRRAEAVSALRCAVELNPLDSGSAATLAEFLWEDGQPGDALAMIEKAIDADPRNSVAHARMALFVAAEGRNEEALASLERALKRRPHTAPVLAAAAEVEQVLGRGAAALSHLRRAVKLEPTVPEWQRRLAETTWRADRPVEALSILDHAQATFGEAGWISALRGQILTDMGRPEEGLYYLVEAADLSPRAGSVQALLGTALAQLGRDTEAVVALEAASSLGASGPFEEAIRGEVLLRLGRVDEAIEILQESIRHDDSNAMSYAILGEALRVKGDVAAAIESLTRAIDRADAADTKAFAYASRGATLAGQGRASEAIADLTQARTLLPEYRWADVVLGEVLNDVGRNGEALDIFDSVLDEDSQSARAHRGRGDALRQLGRHAEAGAALDQAIALAPDDVTSHRLLGYTHLGAGRIDQALAAFQRALDLAPTDNALLSEVAGVLATKGEHDRAEALADRVLTHDPRNVVALRTKVSLLCDTGEFEEAVLFLDKLFLEKAQPISADALLLNYWGWAYQHIPGRHNLLRALKAFQAAVKVDPTDPWILKGLGNVSRALDPQGEEGPEFMRKAIDAAARRIPQASNRLAVSGWCYYSLGDLDTALDLLGQALLADPLQVSAEFDFALATMCAEAYERAERKYKAALRHADLRPAHYRKGLLRVARYDISQARLLYPHVEKQLFDRCDSLLAKRLEKTAEEVAALARSAAANSPRTTALRA
jgi:tetratricopeptide (TPR) repeat protein